MQKKAQRLLLFLFLLLGGLSFWYLCFSPDPRSTALGEERSFAVPDTNRIGKIFLARRDGETIELVRQGAEWRYNGRWKVRPGAMESLLDAVSRIEIKYKPAQAAVPNMIKSLATEGIKVELYNRSGKPIHTYYVGGGTVDERGTYVIREGFDQPYVAHLPGWEGNLRFRFNLKGEDWRDRSVFAEDPDQIQQVTMEYPKQRNMSFRLEKVKGGFEVLPFYSSTPTRNLPLRPGAAEAFLVGFESLVAEAFENAYPFRDSVQQLLPFVIITVTDLQGREKQVKLFPIQKEVVAVDPKSGQLPSSGEIERYFAETSAGDFMLVQNRVFKKILWAYPFFFDAL